MPFGIFGKKKDDKKEEEPQQPEKPKVSLNSLSDDKNKPTDAQSGSAWTNDPTLAQMPEPKSSFEFGSLVSVGDEMMRGVCTGEDPDAIQACTWTVEPLQGKHKDKKPKYQIEF